MYGYWQIEAIAMKLHYIEIANTSNIVQKCPKNTNKYQKATYFNEKRLVLSLFPIFEKVKIK